MAIATINPATGEVIKTFQPLSDAEIEKKLQLSVSAFKAERKTPFATRAKRMLKAAEILERDKDEFAHLMTLEMGKPYKAAVAEAVKCATACRYYAENTERFLADEVVETGAKKSFIRYLADRADAGGDAVELSVLAGVPVRGAGADGGQRGTAEARFERAAVRAGDRDIFLEAGFPEGAFQTLLIGSEQVDALLNDPRVVAATLTGSEQAGIQVGIRRGASGSRKSCWSWGEAIRLL